MPNVSPTVSLGINLAVAVLGVVAGSSSYFTGMFGSHESTIIVQTAGFTLGILGAVNTVLHGYSSAQAGPMAK